MQIHIIAAVAKENRAIGLRNTLPWHIPEDFRYFKQVTLGHPIIMGKKTFLSIGKALPGRTNIILTRDDSFSADDVLVAKDAQQALQFAEQTGDTEVFVIGGSQVYETFLPIADRLYITLVPGEYEADTFFPDYSNFDQEVSREICTTQVGDIEFLVLEK